VGVSRESKTKEIYSRRKKAKKNKLKQNNAILQMKKKKM